MVSLLYRMHVHARSYGYLTQCHHFLFFNFYYSCVIVLLYFVYDFIVNKISNVVTYL